MNDINREVATHVGVCVSYIGTPAYRDVVTMFNRGVERKIRFFFPRASTDESPPVEHVAYVLKDGDCWRVPNSERSFNLVDGECKPFGTGCFVPIFLDLDSLSEL